MALTIDTSGSIDPDEDAITVSVFIDNMSQPGNEPRRTVLAPRPGPAIRVDVSDGKLTASADQRVFVPYTARPHDRMHLPQRCRRG